MIANNQNFKVKYFNLCIVFYTYYVRYFNGNKDLLDIIFKINLLVIVLIIIFINNYEI